MNNILVTGGCGFIGSHLIEQLYKDYENINVVNLDCLTYCGNLRNTESFCDRKDYTFVKASITDADIISNILKEYKIDTIINLAAQTHVDRSIKNPKEFLETDIFGTFTLAFESIKHNKIKHFYHVSTDEIYGPLQHPIEADESFVLNPTSPYSASKASADLLLFSYYKTYGLPISIVRPCNNYGSRQYVEKLIPICITQLLDGKKIPVHGSGSPVREWIHVNDCTRAISNLLPVAKSGEVYNVGSGLRYSNAAIISSVIYTVTGDRGSKMHKYLDFVNDRPGNDSRYALNSTKLESLIGRYLYHDNMLEDLKEMIDWYSKHEQWWENVDISSNFHSENYLR